ncbi:hypothetical protein PAHAL_4G077600 [Panicum hallii]|uniref:Uncharacterized protein n=1 Tax=Panicum hallii TaxID=206008 RepID=A0A2T8JC61_9POAL|nr:hypothetical protein PAHAL_4G077600 [Panicum hallii]
MKSERAEEAHIDNLGKKLPQQRTGTTRYSSICACQSLGVSTFLPEAACTTRSRRQFRFLDHGGSDLRTSHRAVKWILAELWYWFGDPVLLCFLIFFDHMHVLFYQ